MDNNLNIRKHDRIPSYVSVYNSLYADIKNGVYLENEFLPSEQELSKKYGVSRNTLRQALAILSEDGLIIKSQGKGTVITRSIKTDYNKKTSNPMTNLSVKKIDNIEIFYNFNPPTNIAREKLELEKNDIILASDNIYSSGNKNMGFSFIQIPMRVVEQLDIDVSDEEDINQLVNKKIFEITNTQHIEINLISANKKEQDFLNIEEGSPILLMRSLLYNKHMTPIGRCKFYFIPDCYKLKFIL